MPAVKQQKQTAALVDLGTFEEARAISLRDAILAGYLNERGRRPSLQVVQRWANPKRGCAPVGDGGPAVVLPTVMSGNRRVTMVEWVQAFVREKARIKVERARRLAG